MVPSSERGSNGQFLPGNQSAVTHGRYSNLDRPELRVLIEDERHAVIDALGGAEALSPQMLRVVESYAENVVLRQVALTKMFDAGGMVTSKGKTRAIFKVWQQLDETMVRRAQVLGLERRAKPVESLKDILA
jgi:hypothetical protein